MMERWKEFAETGTQSATGRQSKSLRTINVGKKFNEQLQSPDYKVDTQSSRLT